MAETPKTKEKRVGIQAFATWAGCDKKSVKFACDQGLFEDAAEFVGGRWLIDKEQGRAKWAKNHRPTGTTPPRLMQFLHGSLQPPPQSSAAATEQRVLAMTRAEADRKKAAYAALEAQRDYEVSMETLVKKSDVMDALFSFGAIARTTLETLPAQLVDAIRGAATRHEALQNAKQAIRDALTFLADLENGNVPLKTGR